MIYRSGTDYLTSGAKRVLIFGMSGLGKTHASTLLRDTGDWFHYSVDYRIGTRYMGEHIADMFKREAMKVPLLRDLLMSDSVYIASNITFDNLAPLSTYLGKPGDPARGGLPIAEYRRRQDEHREAEIAATLDATRFIERAHDLYGYAHFVCDTSGSICEVVDPEDPDDPVLAALEEALLLVWIEGTDAHREALIARFDRAPKPMYYRAETLAAFWAEYLALSGRTADQVDPDAFLRFGYARLLAARQPRYAAMARRGVTITAEEAAGLTSAADFDALVARAIDRKPR
jgi:hypothetical protein